MRNQIRRGKYLKTGRWHSGKDMEKRSERNFPRYNNSLQEEFERYTGCQLRCLVSEAE